MSESDLIPNGIEVIAYDWDMTLVDSSGKLTQNLAIAHEFNNPLAAEDVRRHWNESTGFADLMNRLTNGADFDTIMEVVKRDYHNPEYAKQRFDHAIAHLEVIRGLGYKTAIISGVQRELLEQDALDLDIAIHHLFDFIQAQDDCEFKKPDPRVFDPVLRHFSISAEKLLYIGDEQKDFIAAQAAGVDFIGVESGMTTAGEFEQLGAIHVPNVNGVMPHASL